MAAWRRRSLTGPAAQPPVEQRHQVAEATTWLVVHRRIEAAETGAEARVRRRRVGDIVGFDRRLPLDRLEMGLRGALPHMMPRRQSPGNHASATKFPSAVNFC